MGAKDKRKKEPKIVDAEITDDGCLIIEMNLAFKMGNSKKIMLPPETLLALGEEYASIPAASETDFPGVPVLEVEDVFADEGDGIDDGDDGESGSKSEEEGG